MGQGMCARLSRVLVVRCLGWGIVIGGNRVVDPADRGTPSAGSDAMPDLARRQADGAGLIGSNEVGQTRGVSGYQAWHWPRVREMRSARNPLSTARAEFDS